MAPLTLPLRLHWTFLAKKKILILYSFPAPLLISVSPAPQTPDLEVIWRQDNTLSQLLTMSPPFKTTATSVGRRPACLGGRGRGCVHGTVRSAYLRVGVHGRVGEGHHPGGRVEGRCQQLLGLPRRQGDGRGSVERGVRYRTAGWVWVEPCE